MNVKKIHCSIAFAVALLVVIALLACPSNARAESASTALDNELRALGVSGAGATEATIGAAMEAVVDAGIKAAPDRVAAATSIAGSVGAINGLTADQKAMIVAAALGSLPPPAQTAAVASITGTVGAEFAS